MEKIYMEECKKQKQKLFDVSVVLSFVVAVMAVFSLATFGIVTNQGTDTISYAAPVSSDTFTLKWGKVVFARDSIAEGPFNLYRMETYFYDTANNPENVVFCIERNKTIINNNSYSKIATAREGTKDLFGQDNDEGLKYLLGIGTNKASLQAVTEGDDTVDIWAVQSAIWYYLSEKYPDVDAYKLNVTSGQSLNDKNVIMTDGPVYLSIVNPSTDPNQSEAPDTYTPYEGLTGPNGKIMQLVHEAEAATSAGNRVIVTKADDNISRTDDKKYYQSSLITVSGDPTNSLLGYDVSLTGLDGAIIVGEDGESLNTTDIAPGTKFYVRVPAEKVTESVQKVNVSVTGHFTGASGTYYYVEDNADLQRMASVEPGDVAGGIEVEFIGTPDTGMNTAQTIYFIGLIILLCGVGIVYANAKPVKSRQQ